jgi:hypothetical protein
MQAWGKRKVSLYPYIIYNERHQMKILLLNQAFVSPDEPGHTRHFEMAQYLLKHGHELVIVASDLNYQTGQRIVKHRGLFTEQVIEGVRILRSYICIAVIFGVLFHFLALCSVRYGQHCS